MINITLTWSYQAENVFITGTFVNWNSMIKMTKIDNVFIVNICISHGIHQYKFIVDGKWCYDILKPTIDDNYGGKNNLINVKDDTNEILIVHISDTFGNFHPLLPSGDILVHTGNFTKNGTYEEIQIFDEWLSKQQHIYKIIILGPNEMKIANNFVDPIEEYKKLIKNAIILNNEYIDLFGLTLFGIEWNYKNILNKINYPNKIDVFISHQPPHNILDIFSNGSKEILEHVKNYYPKLHLFGNVCEKYGTKKIKWNDFKITKFSNACSVDRNNKEIKNNPIVIKINSSSNNDVN
jgi:hypothetical protein